MADSNRQLEIPPRGTHGSGGFGSWFFKFARPLMNMEISRYRKNAGPEAPRVMDFPGVLLTTTGARTGRERTQILGGFADGEGRWLVVASKGGAPTHPHWFINLAKHPDKVWLEVGNRKMRVTPQVLKGAEREAALERISKVAPRYGKYQTKTDREIPIVRLEQIPG
ncbi:MAG TPA: nitroreductase/quinone reductase family protein [Candidatus Udaeobacter sp.]|nr:nitroreductase/quinone reductase family protein [Candidatus Udaeobacter sp.]